MDKVVKYLLCFLVGFFLAQMFGDGFSVGGNLTPLLQQVCTNIIPLNNPQCVVFSPDGNTVATSDGTIKLFNVADGTLLNTLKGHTDVVSCVAFGKQPYDDMIASGSFDKTVKYWNVADGKMLSNFSGHTDIVTSITYCHQEYLDCFVTSSPDNTIIFRQPGGDVLDTIKDQNTTGRGLSMSPKGYFLLSPASIDSSKGSIELIKLFSIATPRAAGGPTILKTYSGSGYHINDVAWSADGKTIAGADLDSIFIVKAGKYFNVDNENIMGSPRENIMGSPRDKYNNVDNIMGSPRDF